MYFACELDITVTGHVLASCVNREAKTASRGGVNAVITTGIISPVDITLWCLLYVTYKLTHSATLLNLDKHVHVDLNNSDSLILKSFYKSEMEV